MSGTQSESILELREISKVFGRGSAFSGLFGKGSSEIKALDRVSLSLSRGKVLGLVGESGSGKSTLANIVLGLETPTEGHLLVEGQDLAAISRAARRNFRTRVQMIFQDPHGSLNPRFTVGRTVGEPLLVNGVSDAEERQKRVLAALEDAELRPAEAFVDRFPHELSGGQRQRVAIARAIILEPALLVADEPVSMLDVSVRAGILTLLRRLVDERQMAMVFITHDLSLICQICDDVAILFRGCLAEAGEALSVMMKPEHPYTRELLAAVPVPDPDYVAPDRMAPAFTTTAEDARQGCPFVVRCPEAREVCRSTYPASLELADGRRVACHNVKTS
ncbi:MAG: ABC transporter ATP-binding protein [Rhodovibrionaceae bacterium]